MWKNIVESDRPQKKIWCSLFARLISKATNISSEYVILIAHPLQQWLHKRASVLRDMCIACLVITEVESVSCAVQTELLYKTDYVSSMKSLSPSIRPHLHLAFHTLIIPFTFFFRNRVNIFSHAFYKSCSSQNF
jgi:hypothetical protein